MSGTVKYFVPAISCQIMNSLVDVLVEAHDPLKIQSVDSVTFHILRNFFTILVIHILLFVTFVILLVVLHLLLVVLLIFHLPNLI